MAVESRWFIIVHQHKNFVIVIKLLTATCNEWHIEKTAKIIKRWYYSTAYWQLDVVMVSDITFLWFLLFSMCHSLHIAINKCINWCFVHLLLSMGYLYLNTIVSLVCHWHCFDGQDCLQICSVCIWFHTESKPWPPKCMITVTQWNRLDFTRLSYHLAFCNSDMFLCV